MDTSNSIDKVEDIQPVVCPKKDFKQQLDKLFSNKKFQMWMNIIRFSLLVIAVCIMLVLVRDIEAVKLLGTDACKLCMNQTGATCISTTIHP